MRDAGMAVVNAFIWRFRWLISLKENVMLKNTGYQNLV
jgi:hypothetical protein